MLRQRPTNNSSRESDEDEWQGKDLLDLRCLDDEDSDYIGLSLTFGHQGQQRDDDNDLCPKCHPVQRPAANANAVSEVTADRPNKAGSSFTSSPNLYDTARIPLLDVEEFNSRPDLLPGRHPSGTDALDRSESEVNVVADLDASSFVQRKLSASAPDIIGFGGTSPDDDDDDLGLIECEGYSEDGCILQASASPLHDNSTNTNAAAVAVVFQSAGETVQLEHSGLDETVVRPTRR